MEPTLHFWQRCAERGVSNDAISRALAGEQWRHKTATADEICFYDRNSNLLLVARGGSLCTAFYLRKRDRRCFFVNRERVHW